VYKRGVSGVVTALLVVLIAIIASGILWIGIKTFLTDASHESEDTSCLSTTIHITSCSINQTSNITTVSVSRPSGKAQLDALNFLFYSDQKYIKITRNNSLPNELETATFSFTDPAIIFSDRVDVGTVLGGQICQPTGAPLKCGTNTPNRPNNHEDNNDSDSSPPPFCDDGLDNDGDSWTDSQDSDCYTNGIYDENNSETFFALSTCSDGIDNNGDGSTDSQDTSCALSGDKGDEHTTILISGPGSRASQCSDGLDNDGDGLADYPNDPGCSNLGDDNEGDETRTHNFQFSFGGDGYIKEINWTNSLGVKKRVIWEELSGRYGGCTTYGCGGVRYYLHSSLGDYAGYGWSYNISGVKTVAGNATIKYSKVSQSSDEVKVVAQDSNLLITDTIRFYQDTMFIAVNVTNKINQRIDNIVLPINIGSLYIGKFDSSYLLTSADTGISRLVPGAAGIIENNFNSNGAVEYTYPSLYVFSPLNVLWDNNISLGMQLLTDMRLPDLWSVYDKTQQQYTPSIISKLRFSLQPRESRVYIFAIKLANGNNWQSSLTPYKTWFDSRNGNPTPRYCPDGPFITQVGSNNFWINPPVYDNSQHRYRAGLTLAQVFRGDNPAAINAFRIMGIEQFGIWKTAVYSGCLIGNKDCSREIIPECGPLDNGDNCEFNANIDLIDPNLDAGPDRSKINSLASAYQGGNVDLFWFTRPCMEITGANITYGSNGAYSFVAGQPHGYADLDLRNISNRDRQFARLDDLASRGVNGFYFDATGCPGDEAFLEYSRRQLETKYGKDFFLVVEGARDRVGLLFSQIPLLKNPTYSFNSSRLSEFLVPQATYFAGAFNNPLNVTPPEIFDAIDRGDQAAVFGAPLTLSELSSFTWDGTPIASVYCRLVGQSYINRYNLWQQYGSSLGCPQPPQHPPWYPTCPA
jgi:hypothetical protein